MAEFVARFVDNLPQWHVHLHQMGRETLPLGHRKDREQVIPAQPLFVRHTPLQNIHSVTLTREVAWPGHYLFKKAGANAEAEQPIGV